MLKTPIMALVTVAFGAFQAATCSGRPSPAGADDLLVEPIAIESVEVSVLESFPPQAVAHVRGVLGDGCSELHSVRQERTDHAVTVTILRERPRDAICIQIARMYDESIRLEGTYPSGEYVLHVNDFVTRFRTD